MERKAGDEWLITLARTEFHILVSEDTSCAVILCLHSKHILEQDVYEEQVRVQPITVLRKDQYAIIVDPVNEDGKNQ